jgi:hypothetical protein
MLRADAMFKRLKASRLDNSTEAEMRRLAQTRLLIIGLSRPRDYPEVRFGNRACCWNSAFLQRERVSESA